MGCEELAGSERMSTGKATCAMKRKRGPSVNLGRIKIIFKHLWAGVAWI